MQIVVQGPDSVDIQNLTLTANSYGVTCGGSFSILSRNVSNITVSGTFEIIHKDPADYSRKWIIMKCTVDSFLYISTGVHYNFTSQYQQRYE